MEAVTAASEAPSLESPELFTNRELSWLQFNERVLELAEDERTPLLERVKFCAIYASNLDEFVMVRVAGIHDQVDAGIEVRGVDGLSPGETLERINQRLRELGDRHSRVWDEQLSPALAEHGIRVVDCDTCEGEHLREIDRIFAEQIFPVLTPLAVGPGRPFPYISNLSLSIAVWLRDPVSRAQTFARVKVPKEVLPRFVQIGEDAFVPLESIIARHLDTLFPGMEILSHDYFRVTRDADFTVSDEADDLLRAVEDELRRRRFGEVVRLEVSSSMDPDMREYLIEQLAVDESQVIDVSGDGANDSGRTVTLARDEALARGITINGLPIMLKWPDGPWDIEDLDLYFRDCVIGGPGAFLVPVREKTHFVEAIKAKLVREITDQPPHRSLVHHAQTDSSTNCLAGELRRHQPPAR